MDKRTNELGELNGSFHCRCQQPCKQSIYSVTYSPAKWPSHSLNVQLGICNGTAAECNRHYNSAFIPCCGNSVPIIICQFVNLLADFGGQLGLWCGISFLTCCEFIFLLCETAYMSAQYNYILWKKKKEKARELDKHNNLL
ncbi:unnamed protein product [Brugia timori]|uniref:Uncharacterized protein n=1 Tax=Brugia timori TaxID=42155 RepID=A0A3P7XZL0_9BILA|nr:unnamed protein product [Brugia timori]